jgi:hypothetical protein
MTESNSADIWGTARSQIWGKRCSYQMALTRRSPRLGCRLIHVLYNELTNC